jgi:hypothetical protein
MNVIQLREQINDLSRFTTSELTDELCKRGYCLRELEDNEMISVGYSTIVGPMKILVVE